MAGIIIADTIRSSGNTVTLNSATQTVATINATGIYSSAGNLLAAGTFASPTFSGTVTGTYTLGGTPSIAATALTGTIAAARLPAGSVLQVVSATQTAVVSISGSSFADISGLSVSITPTSNTNKVLIFGFLNAVSGDLSFFRIVRNSTAICIGDAAGTRIQSTGGAFGTGSNATWASVNMSFNFLDSPATTSATTYKLQFAGNSAVTTYLNRGSGDGDSGNAGRTASTITIMEIAV